jgi:hypothetical protein
MFMAARRKYWPKHDNIGTTCFNRTIVKNDANFLSVVRRYEVPVGVYTTRAGKIIPDQALALYCLLNPRSMIKAWGKMQKIMAVRMESEILHGQSQDYTRMESDFKTCVHKSVAEKLYVELDIDTKDEIIVRKVIKLVRPMEEHLRCIVETRGGYHVVMDNIHISKEQKSLLWRTFSTDEYKFDGHDVRGKPIRKSYVDVRSDPSPPIPGTIQGGFNVRFVDWEEFQSI